MVVPASTLTAMQTTLHHSHSGGDSEKPTATLLAERSRSSATVQGTIEVADALRSGLIGTHQNYVIGASFLCSIAAIPYTTSVEYESEEPRCDAVAAALGALRLVDLIAIASWLSVALNLLAVLASLMVLIDLDGVPREAILLHACSLRLTYTAPLLFIVVGLAFNATAWLLDIAARAECAYFVGVMLVAPCFFATLGALFLRMRWQRQRLNGVLRGEERRWGAAWVSTWADAIPEAMQTAEVARELESAVGQ